MSAKPRQRALCHGMRLVLAALLLVFLSGCRAGSGPATEGAACNRVVSLSPSVTEILFALGLERQLVGVTKYCAYPPQARQKAVVGGYMDPDIETIVRLKPDLVIIREEAQALQDSMARFGIATLRVEHRSVPGILASIQTIGERCNRKIEAEKLRAGLESDMRRITAGTADVRYRPRVLVAVDRDLRYNNIRQVYIAAKDGLYNWMIEQAGGQNAYDGESLSGFLPVSAEGILRMNPEVIIEIQPLMKASGKTEADAIAQWQSLKQVAAVQNGRIHILEESAFAVPGPRFVGTLERFARIIHPELDWSAPRGAL